MLFPEEEMRKLLEFFPENQRNTIQYQIGIVEEIIKSNIKKYKFYPGYKEAIDLVLEKIMKGEFIGDE